MGLCLEDAESLIRNIMVPWRSSSGLIFQNSAPPDIFWLSDKLSPRSHGIPLPRASVSRGSASGIAPSWGLDLESNCSVLTTRGELGPWKFPARLGEKGESGGEWEEGISSLRLFRGVVGRTEGAIFAITATLAGSSMTRFPPTLPPKCSSSPTKFRPTSSIGVCETKSICVRVCCLLRLYVIGLSRDLARSRHCLIWLGSNCSPGLVPAKGLSDFLTLRGIVWPGSGVKTFGQWLKI